MAITLSSAYLAQLKAGNNNTDIILSVELDSGTVKWGFASGNGFSDVAPIIDKVGSKQNKLNQSKGASTRGSITFTIIGRDNFKTLMQNEFLKNRRVTRHDGFIATGFLFSEYAKTFTGLISNWTRKGDTLTLTVMDDLAEGVKKIPVANATKTQFIDFTGSGAGMNPVDIMQNIIKTQMGISASLVDDTQFDFEQETWLAGHLFSRVLTEPADGNKYLNELQVETNSFIFSDGEKISFKVFAPPLPGTEVESWTDDFNILEGTLTCNSGFADFFFNEIWVYYDYDESGGDDENSFEAVSIQEDSDSKTQWGETKIKVVKSKWIRSLTFIQPTNVTGVVIYHASSNNGAGSGTLTFTFDGGGEHTLKWAAPGGTIGEAVTISKDGKFQVFDADETKWVRVLVTNGDLAGSNQSDSITITSLAGSTFASALGQKLLSRYRNPSSTVTFDVDINNVAFGGFFIKPSDLKDLTTDEAFEKGDATWVNERMMLTSVRPDIANNRVRIEAIETKLYRRPAFIAPPGQPDYGAASDAQREYCYIGDASNLVDSGTVDGYYII